VTRGGKYYKNGDEEVKPPKKGKGWKLLGETTIISLENLSLLDPAVRSGKGYFTGSSVLEKVGISHVAPPHRKKTSHPPRMKKCLSDD